MKGKKLIFFLIGVALAIIIVIAMVVFLIVSKKDDDSQQNLSGLSLVGVWKTVAIEDDTVGTVTFVSDEYLVFDESTAQSYSMGNLIGTSKYSVDSEGYISFIDNNTGYYMAIKTSNYIKFWEDETRCRTYVRYPNSDMSAITYEEDTLLGKWNVTFHDKAKDIESEYWTIADGVVSQYINGATEIESSTAYSWDETNNRLIANDWAQSYVVNYVSENIIVLVQTQTGACLQLERA